MATYSTIKGFTIQSYATDPAASVAASGTWASGNVTNTGRRGPCGLGTQTAAIAAGGNAPPVGTLCESYNGTNWSEVNNLNTARAAIGPGAGSQTAGLCAGGNGPSADVADVEKWDGTCWTEVADLNQIRHSGACMGATNTAAIYSAGSNYPPGSGAEGYLVETESWNGSAWTEVADLNTGRRYVAGVGPSGAAFLLGGAVPPGSTSSAVTEMWNGSSWTNSVSFNTARRYTAASGGASAQSGALLYGGDSPTFSKTEYFDGTSWTEIADMGVAKKSFLGSTLGTTSLALAAFGGPPNPTASEEFTASGTNIVQEGQVWYNTTSNVLKGFGLTLGTGAWASGGAANTGRRYMSIAGTQTSAVTCGGSPPPITATELYDGTAWTTHPSGVLNSDKHNTGGLGQSDSAAMALGGSGYLAISETWNGSTWTEGNNITTGRTFAAAGGTTTSAIMACGETPGSPNTVNSETWNGTSWTEVNNINTSGYLVGHGTASDSASATFIAGGVDRGIKTESWDGTSWSEVADLSRSSPNSAAMASSGSSTNGLVFGGYTSVTGLTESWNGTSWTEVADLATARYGAGGCGSSTLALCSMGAAPATQTVTEEWTVPSSQTIKTFTSS
jgi:hypothetical protein